MNATVQSLLQPLKDRLDSALLHQTLEPADYAEMAWVAVADQAKLIAAIEAVASLHKPFVWDFGFGPVTSCRGCANQGASQEASEYPCPTVAALTLALTNNTPGEKQMNDFQIRAEHDDAMCNEKALCHDCISTAAEDGGA